MRLEGMTHSTFITFRNVLLMVTTAEAAWAYIAMAVVAQVGCRFHESGWFACMAVTTFVAGASVKLMFG